GARARTVGADEGGGARAIRATDRRARLIGAPDRRNGAQGTRRRRGGSPENVRAPRGQRSAEDAIRACAASAERQRRKPIVHRRERSREARYDSRGGQKGGRIARRTAI